MSGTVVASSEFKDIACILLLEMTVLYAQSGFALGFFFFRHHFRQFDFFGASHINPMMKASAHATVLYTFRFNAPLERTLWGY